MSLPDYLLDEPDPCLCPEHLEAHPCLYCRDEAALEWDESRRKGELFEDVLGNRRA